MTVSLSPGEAVLAALLERHISSLSVGHRHRVRLEQLLPDGHGGWRPGGVCGWVERVSPSGIRLRIIPTEAGRTAEALLEDGLLDVVLSASYPPVVRLVEGGE